MLKKLPLLVFALVFVMGIGHAYAQQGTIQGTVTDSTTSETLPGASILVRDLGTGATTDSEGNYTIDNVPVGTYELKASFVGYDAKILEIEVTEGTNMVNFSLVPSTYGMDDVVVTAFGLEKERRNLGYGVSSVEGDEVSESQESNIVNALAGQVSGVSINQGSGQPGKASRIVIRGNTSFLGDNQPLFVVDGNPISNAEDSWGGSDQSSLFTGGSSNRGLDINPSNIADISVLKGASATALYGSRASNGAVIITTKSGQQGQQGVRVSVESSVGWDDPIIEGYQTEYTQGTNGEFYNGLPPSRGGYNSDAGAGNGQISQSWGPHKDSLNAQTSPQIIQDLKDVGFLSEDQNEVPTYNPREDFYRTGTTYRNSLNISGGGDNTSYYVSFSNHAQDGIVPGTELDKNNIMAKFQADLSSDFRTRTSINYVNTENTQLAEGNGVQAYNYGLSATPISFDVNNSQFEDGSQRMYHPAYNNPNWLADNNGYNSSVDRFIGNQNISWDILPWLTITEQLGLDTYVDTRKKETNVGTRGEPNGSMFDQKIQRSEINSDLTLDAQFDLTEDLGVDALVGNNINSRYYKQEFIEGVSLNIPDFFNVSNASTVNAEEQKELRHLVSVYGELVFDYQDFLFLTLTGRNDWSSTLPEDEQSYFYPSAAVGFVFSDILDVPTNILSFGKLRASWAQIGSDAPVYSLRTDYTQAAPQDGVRGVINYPFNGVNAYIQDQSLGNPDLKPELTTEWEVGADLRFLEERLNLDASYYTRTTEDQIFSVPVSSASGYNERLANAGQLTNEGVELSLQATPVVNQDFRWEVRGTWSTNTTTVDELAEGVDNIFLGGFSSATVNVVPGEDGYGAIRAIGWQRDEDGNKVINPASGFPLTTNEAVTIGNVQPDWQANAGTSVRYKGLSLSVLFDISQGGDIFNFDLYYNSYYGTAGVTEDRGSSFVYDGVLADANGNATDQQNDIEITRNQAFYQGIYSGQLENFVEDGSYVKLREVKLGYSLPSGLLEGTPVRSLEISAVGRNLWIDTDFSYGDPVGGLYGSGNAQGYYHAVAPSTRSYHLNLRLSI